VQHYYDSLQVELRQAEFEYATLKDIKNLEMSKFNLINQTPILQLIDQPVYPLKENKPKIFLISFVVLLLTFFFASLFIISNKIIRDALKA